MSRLESSSGHPPGTVDPPAGKVGVLLVGHGTRDPVGQQQFRQLCQQCTALLDSLPCQLAFLELAEPSIPVAVESLVEQQQVQQLLVVPVLLFTAGHAEQDIPAAVDEVLQPMGIGLVGQTQSLECSREVLELSARRFREAACAGLGCPPCRGDLCNQAAWVLVGRGSSSLAAADKMREFTRLRHAMTPTRIVETAFIFGHSPSVAQALDAVARSDAKRVIVQPHLLFSGLLLEQLAEQVEFRRRQNVQQHWSLTPTLGADQLLAELLVDRVRRELTSRGLADPAAVDRWQPRQ